MANTDFPVTVTVNFQGVTYSNGTWSGSPSFNVSPNPLPVRPCKSGDTNTIVWTLRPAAVPAGFAAVFADHDGIKFTGDPKWTGGDPSRQTETTYSCRDNFNDLDANAEFYYSIKVKLKGTGSNDGVNQTFSYDPDVENEAGSAATLTHMTE